MNAQDVVDGSERHEAQASEDVPSLCAVIIDTNPRAWAAISEVLPLSKALANLLVFVNAHLALSHDNQVAILAAHSNRALWLYPAPPKTPPSHATSTSEDVVMSDANATNVSHSANKFPQFAQMENCLLKSLRDLIARTEPQDVAPATSHLSGALTLALAHINKTAITLSEGGQASSGSANTGPASAQGGSGAGASGGLKGLHARILVLSLSDSSPAQYIPTMNAVFAAAHAAIPIDTLALGSGCSPFLQQASFITRGTYLRATKPQGLLTYLMFGFNTSSVPSPASRLDDGDPAVQLGVQALTTKKKKGGATYGGTGSSGTGLLVPPSADVVDFRAACFCHRRVVDTAFVCSICLSIFCEIPKDAECLTCGTKLALGNYGKFVGSAASSKRKEKPGAALASNGAAQ